jgi:hypothetical protein
VTAFDDQGKNEIAPASFYKLRHQRRVLWTTVFMGGEDSIGRGPYQEDGDGAAGQ